MRKVKTAIHFGRLLPQTAERTGFEPADQFPGHRFSKPALSTTQPPLPQPAADGHFRILGNSPVPARLRGGP